MENLSNTFKHDQPQLEGPINLAAECYVSTISCHTPVTNLYSGAFHAWSSMYRLFFSNTHMYKSTDAGDVLFIDSVFLQVHWRYSSHLSSDQTAPCISCAFSCNPKASQDNHPPISHDEQLVHPSPTNQSTNQKHKVTFLTVNILLCL